MKLPPSLVLVAVLVAALLVVLWHRDGVEQGRAEGRAEVAQARVETLTVRDTVRTTIARRTVDTLTRVLTHFDSVRVTDTLPVRVDADKAHAEFENGVLTLRLPKVAEVRPKTIEGKAKGVIEGKSS